MMSFNFDVAGLTEGSYLGLAVNVVLILSDEYNMLLKSH